MLAVDVIGLFLSDKFREIMIMQASMRALKTEEFFSFDGDD